MHMSSLYLCKSSNLPAQLENLRGTWSYCLEPIDDDAHILKCARFSHAAYRYIMLIDLIHGHLKLGHKWPWNENSALIISATWV